MASKSAAGKQVFVIINHSAENREVALPHTMNAHVLVDRHAPKPQPHSEAVPAVVALRELYVEFAIVLQPVNFV